MIMEIREDISSLFFKVDVIVNAANGIGYYGGFISEYLKVKGISEALNYKTKGKIQKVSKKQIKIEKGFFGYNKGDIYKLNIEKYNLNLNCKIIYNAVTMKFPGTFSDEKTIFNLIENIFKETILDKYNSIAIPLLGTGTGGLNKEKIKNKIIQEANKYPELNVYIIDL